MWILVAWHEAAVEQSTPSMLPSLRQTNPGSFPPQVSTFGLSLVIPDRAPSAEGNDAPPALCTGCAALVKRPGAGAQQAAW